VHAGDYPFFQPRFIAMAHRGGWTDEADAPLENTLTAFRHAVDLGYRYLETDVHLTKDGQLIAFHDDSLDRLLGLTGTIGDHTLAQLRSVRIGDRDVVPTLDEILDALPDTRLNIDMKADDTVVPLAQVLARHHAEDRVCVASFSARRLARFRYLMGRRMPTSASIPGAAWNLVPLLPSLIRTDSVALQLPLTYPVAGHDVRVLSRGLIHAAHARGMRVQAWTIDDTDTMRRLIDWGVDGLVSNRIDTLKTVLIDCGLWE
jgi:glycerophosphoryl diester phosphodiesterase